MVATNIVRSYTGVNNLLESVAIFRPIIAGGYIRG
jgi:hypothetical protein